MARSNLTGLTSRRPFTILGIVLALLVIAAFVLVAVSASAGQNVTMESVVVATKNLQPRVPIDVSSLERKSIPVGGFPSAILFTKVSDVTGMVPLVTILEGQPITSNLISKPGGAIGSQSEYLPIQAGYVAMTLPTSEQQGVAGYIAPGDDIAVIATVDVNAKVSTATVFPSLHVIRVGAASTEAAQPATQGIASSLTVVVTECQAEYLTWFLTYASLKYTLLSYHDYQTANVSPDPSCPSVVAAKGVSLKAVMAAYPQLFP